MPTTRTFIAIPLEPHAASAVATLCGRLASQLGQVRWTEPAHLHLTLRFLGDVDNLALPEICERVAEAVGGFEPLSLRLDTLGAFPLGKPPKVLWLGMAEESAELLHWHAALGNVLRELDVPNDGKAFRPHLTIGRVKSNVDPVAIRSAFAAPPPGLPISLEVDTVAVMASSRERGKLHYDRLASIPLA